MARRTLILALFTVLAAASFARADCVRAELPKGSNNFFLLVDPASGVGQISVQIYLEKRGDTQSCTMSAELAQPASGFSVSVTPKEITHAGTYYGVYPITITATASAFASSEIVNVRLRDKDTGAVLATVPVLVGIAEQGSTASPSPTRVCTREDKSGCTEKELIALDVGPNFIEQNLPDVYLLVGIIAAFAIIVLVFFVIIPRK